MDWKSLTEKLNPLTEKLNPYLDKAKDAGFRALDFTQKQLQSTPIVLKTLEEYTLLRESKRFILISYDETDPLAREVLLRSPVWSTQAWSDAAEIRFVEVSSAPEIVRNLDITTPLDMRVWYTGKETFHGTDVESIKNWWKTRCYNGDSEETVSLEKKENTPPDTTKQDVPEEKIEATTKASPKSPIVDPLAEK